MTFDSGSCISEPPPFGFLVPGWVDRVAVDVAAGTPLHPLQQSAGRDVRAGGELEDGVDAGEAQPALQWADGCPAHSDEVREVVLGQASPAATAPEVETEALPQRRLGAQLWRGPRHHRRRSKSSTRLTRTDLDTPSPLEILPRPVQVRLVTPRSIWLM